MEFDWSPEDKAHRAEIKNFLKEVLPTNWDDMSSHGPGSDIQAHYSREFCGKMAEKGWLTQHWPSEYGGKNAAPWRHAVVGEEMWAIGEPRGSQYMNVNWIGPAIMKYGSDKQKALHLPLISSGNVLWCQGFSEPEAGSDLAALRTRAEKKDGHYIINGSKIWTSYCRFANYCFLLVRTDASSKRHNGISVLLVPMDTAGIVVREIPSVVGDRYFHEVFFTDVKVPVDVLLGKENEGWEVVNTALQFERIGAARYARATVTLDKLAEVARERGMMDDPMIVDKLGEARALCEAARVLVYKVIDLRAKDSPPTADTQVARVLSTQCDNAIGRLALDIFGPESLEYASYADSNFRLAMTAGVAVGATEVQLNLIASRFLNLPKE